MLLQPFHCFSVVGGGGETVLTYQKNVNYFGVSCKMLTFAAEYAIIR